jgi:two-component system, OmpR family, phosphate regulon sensor histidine kinase PhoR
VKTTLQVHARDYFRQHVQVDIQLLPCSLLADRLKLQQALTHLLHNALKFSPEEGIIRIHAFALPDGGLAISVSDEGSGFGERQLAYLNEINESFSFHDRNRRLLGFGLPLARELVYLHGGNLLFRNTEEGGAEVTIILPRERVIGVRKQAAKTQRSRHSRQPIMESYA